MNEPRDTLSTADLAGQEPDDDTPVNRRDEADLRPGDVSADDSLRDDVRAADQRDEPDPVDERDLADEPDPADTPVADSVSAPPTPTAGPLLASGDSESYRARWTDVQTAFVDSPRQSVEQADALVAELMQHLAKTFADERQNLERQWDRGDDVQTDDLRTAFQRYLSFFERLLAT